MRQTLFYIPDRIGDLPIFGDGKTPGLLLGLWILGWAAVLIWTVAVRKRPVDWLGTIPIAAIGAGVIWKILPMMVESIPGGGAGLPIRGYGVMLLIAVVAAVMIAIHRARQVGYPTEAILTMTFFAFVCGIAGARLFYVIQYWEQFARDDVWSSVQAMANVIPGGLVVYGGFIGGGLGVLGYLLWNRLPVFRTGDIVAPSLMIGLALGRIGCLFNGCCYGGVCSETQWTAIRFPQGSVPYMEQLHRGSLVGLDYAPRKETDRQPPTVEAVTAGSVADRAGVREGDRLAGVGGGLSEAFVDPDVAKETVALHFVRADGASADILASDLPRASLPLYPTQIFSSIDAALLCALLWFWYPFRRREGQIFGMLLVLYPITRFVEESIRDDVGGYFDTPLTISQHVSLWLLVVAAVYWVVLFALSPPIADETNPSKEPAPA